MPKKTLSYIILEDAYYIALDIKKMMGTLCPQFLLCGIAETAADAIAMILSHSPELLIADSTAADGDTMTLLHQAGVEIPIIFISEYASIAKRANAFSCVAFILKPVTPADLEMAVAILYDSTTSHTQYTTSLTNS